MSLKLNLFFLLLFLALPTLAADLTVNLAWDPPKAGETVDGYKLHWGVVANEWPKPNSVMVVSDLVTPETGGPYIRGRISGLEFNKTYYIVATAFAGGMESNPSNTVVINFPENPNELLKSHKMTGIKTNPDGSVSLTFQSAHFFDSNVSYECNLQGTEDMVNWHQFMEPILFTRPGEKIEVLITPPPDGKMADKQFYRLTWKKNPGPVP